MTAVKKRRTRNTRIALAVAVLGLIGAVVLAVAGVRTLADSTAGQEVGGDSLGQPVQRFPFTSTALVGAVDDEGLLTTVVAIVLEPDGTGGTIVSIAATADASSGLADQLRPLNALLAADGGAAFRRGAESLTGLSYDVIELVDQERFAQLVRPLGDLPTRFPTPLHDESSDESWPAGEVVLSAASASRAITATDSTIEDWYLEPSRVAVWEAIADRVGAGIGSASPVGADDRLVVPASLDVFIDRLFAGPVDFRPLEFTPLDQDRVEDELSDEFSSALGDETMQAVVIHDRAEILLVLGGIAPGRMGAPRDAATYRVISGYSDARLEELGLNNSDVTKLAIDRLLFGQVNVVSVVIVPDRQVPANTQIAVADPAVAAGIAEVYGELFGRADIVVADVLTEGIDIQITLGDTFLDRLANEALREVEN